MDKRTDNGIMPIGATDATICSDDSAYAAQNSIVDDSPKTEGPAKVKAYVDFTDFNRNYEDYLKKKGRRP